MFFFFTFSVCGAKSKTEKLKKNMLSSQTVFDSCEDAHVSKDSVYGLEKGVLNDTCIILLFDWNRKAIGFRILYNPEPANMYLCGHLRAASQAITLKLQYNPNT